MRNRWILLTALIAAICASYASAQQDVYVPVAQQEIVQQQLISQDDARVISLTLTNSAILQALDTLLKDTGRSYQIKPGTRVDGVVTITLRDVPLDTAVQIVLRSAGLQAARKDKVYTITPIPVVAMQQAGSQQMVPGTMPFPPVGTMDVKPSRTTTGGQKFDILLDKANVLESMKQIMEVAHQNYVIDMGLDSAWAGPLGPRISSRMRGIALDEAVQALGKSANLVVALVGSTYTVRPPDGALPFSYIGPSGGGKGNVKSSVTMTTGPSGLAPCARCSSPLLPTWQYCPRCGTQVPTPAPAGK